MGLDVIHHVRYSKLDSERKLSHFLSREGSRSKNKRGRETSKEQERIRGEETGPVTGRGAVGCFDRTLTPETTNQRAELATRISHRGGGGPRTYRETQGGA